MFKVIIILLFTRQLLAVLGVWRILIFIPLYIFSFYYFMC